MPSPRESWRSVVLGAASGTPTLVAYDASRADLLIHGGRRVPRVLAARLRSERWHRLGPYCDGDIWYRTNTHPRRRPSKRIVVAAIDLSCQPPREQPAMTEPNDAVARVLSSARIDGLLDPDPRFVRLLRAYANGVINRADFEAQIPDTIFAAVASDAAGLHRS